MTKKPKSRTFDTACKAFSKCFTYPDDNSTSIGMDLHFRPPSRCPVNEAKAIMSLARSDMKSFGLIDESLENIMIL